MMVKLQTAVQYTCKKKMLFTGQLCHPSGPAPTRLRGLTHAAGLPHPVFLRCLRLVDLPVLDILGHSLSPFVHHHHRARELSSLASFLRRFRPSRLPFLGGGSVSLSLYFTFLHMIKGNAGSAPLCSLSSSQTVAIMKFVAQGIIRKTERLW